MSSSGLRQDLVQADRGAVSAFQFAKDDGGEHSPWGVYPTGGCAHEEYNSRMHIPIELRNNKSSAENEQFVTFAKIELTEIPQLIPDAIQVNGRWFIPADGSLASAQASIWESLNPEPCKDMPPGRSVDSTFTPSV